MTAVQVTERAPRALPALRPSEESIHRAVVQYLERAAYPTVAWTHIPSGEARNAGIGGKLKGLGTKPGWPDLVFVFGGRFYGLELKTELGRTSKAQKIAHANLSLAGAHVAVAYGVDEAIAQLKAWGITR